MRRNILDAIRDQAYERAAMAARDALVSHEWPPQDGDVQCDEVVNAILALKSTPTHRKGE